MTSCPSEREEVVKLSEVFFCLEIPSAKNSYIFAVRELALNVIGSPTQILLSESKLVSVISGIGFMLIVILLLIAEHPLAVVTFTLTVCPLE